MQESDGSSRDTQSSSSSKSDELLADHTLQGWVDYLDQLNALESAIILAEDVLPAWDILITNPDPLADAIAESPKIERDKPLVLHRLRERRIEMTKLILARVAIHYDDEPDTKANLEQVVSILNKSSKKYNSALLSEADIYTSKVKKIAQGKIILQRIKDQGRDAYYLQEKAGGIYVAHER